MQHQHYTIDYFIKKFTAIPDDQWVIGKFYDPENLQRFDASGHCGVLRRNDTNAEIEALNTILRRYFPDGGATPINDGLGKFRELFGNHPKWRILRALQAAKDAENALEKVKAVVRDGCSTFVGASRPEATHRTTQAFA